MITKNHFQGLLIIGSCIFLLLQQQLHAQCPTAPGNQSTYGTNEWIGYVYNGLDGANPPANPFGGTYVGYVTQPETFDYNLGTGSISGANICGSYSDNFSIRFKMRKTFAPGYYNFAVGGDDGFRLSVDGGATFPLQHWQDHGYVNYTQHIYVSGTVDLVLEFYDHGGDARVSFSYTASSCSATPVTSIVETASGCGDNRTLTATGGTEVSGGHYQWGTGQVAGNDILWGNSGSTLSISPTSPTWYWVRRYSPPPCNGYVDATYILVTPTTSTSPVSTDYGINEWKVYGYTGSHLNMWDAVYKGVYTQTSLGFNTQASWDKGSNPSTASNWVGCSVSNDNFVIVHRRQGFPCGRYTLVMENWDDETQVNIDGIEVWYRSGTSGGVGAQTVGTYYLNDNSRIEVKTHEGAGDAYAQLNITLIPETPSVAPTSINGNNTICHGSSTTLTAMGGTLGANSQYEWGTGETGSNIIANMNGSSITVSPTTETKYWVRIRNTFCGTYTPEATITIDVDNTIAGNLSTTLTTICPNSLPEDITLSGYSGNIIKWQSADNAAFTLNVTDIVNHTATLTGHDAGVLTATKYFRAFVQDGVCGQTATLPMQINVSAPIIWNGTWSAAPDATTAIIVESNLTVDNDTHICSCEVKNNALLTINPGVSFTVKGKIKVAPTARLLLHNTASLIQNDNIVNEGLIEVRRNSSKVKRLDYTLWSSPVLGQQLLAFSPLTLTNRFYEYNTASNQYASISATGNFETAKGYLIRTPNNHPTVATVQAGTFKGVANNGTIIHTINYNSPSLSYNAIGNPYPSPLSVADFIDTNLSAIEGTLWFWRKTNDSNETRSYSTVTKFGYTANSAAGGENDYALDPNGIINTGQGFIVKASGAGTITFNNAMRVSSSSNQFFRTSANTTPSASRIWLNVSTATAFSQTMFGYVSDATLGYDNGYDGLAIIDGNLNIYSYIDDIKLAIQARPNFTIDDVVHLGFKTTTPGTFTFSIDHVDGLFSNNYPVYIKDNLLNLTHNIAGSGYTFTSDAGTFENRFEVVYVPMEVLGENPSQNVAGAVIYQKGKQIYIDSTDQIQSIAVYDLLGRIIYKEDKIVKEHYVSPVINASTQVVIIKAITANNKESAQKVILE